MQEEAYEREHSAFVRSRGAECTVLLRSDGTFPVEEPCRIALYGSGARNTVKGGTGSGEVNSRYSVSVEEGLEKAGFTVTDTMDVLFVPDEDVLAEAFEKGAELARSIKE